MQEGRQSYLEAVSLGKEVCAAASEQGRKLCLEKCSNWIAVLDMGSHLQIRFGFGFFPLLHTSIKRFPEIPDLTLTMREPSQPIFCKQQRSRSDATERGVRSGSLLFAPKMVK